MLSGDCVFPSCFTSCKKQSLAVSLDKLHCVPCGDQSTYDDSTGECVCPNGWKLVEKYNSTSSVPIRHECVACRAGATVIREAQLDPGQHYHVSAGETFTPDPFVCAACPDPEMEFDADNHCKCRQHFVLVGDASIAAQKCISTDHIPSISSDYSTVKFNFLEGQGEDEPSMNIDSIIFSHYYLDAASRCEFSQGLSTRTLNACQTLANLCVMSSYDNNAAACLQFRSIAKRRRDGGVPPLFYDDEVDDILRDRSIQMQMTLRGEREGFENVLTFKLAKYKISGEFLGFENLDSQFMPCFSGKTASMNVAESFEFGKSFSIEHECDLNEIMGANSEMYFYELYLVDKGASCGSGDDCLYPIPVLSTTYTEDNTFPNINKITADEIDDKYVRRFVIFDNMVSEKKLEPSVESIFLYGMYRT